jgi:hypothetical protein
MLALLTCLTHLFQNLSVPSADDVLSGLRAAPSRPAQKSQDVIAGTPSCADSFATVGLTSL